MMYNQPSIPPSNHHHHYNPMANHAIHGNLLEITVVGCNKLKDTEWFSRQDPYVCVEYGNNKSRTRVCTDGGKNPMFQEKFVYSLIEGVRELNIVVWNSNTLSQDDFIGSEKVQLAKVLSDGYDDSSWPLHTKTGRHAGEVRLIMRYSGANNSSNSYAPSAALYGPSSMPYSSMYSAPPPASSTPYYPPPTSLHPYPPTVTEAYPMPSYFSPYPPNSGAYPPSQYPPQAAPNSPYSPPPYPPQAAPNSVYSPSPYPPHETPNSASSPSPYPHHTVPTSVYSPSPYPLQAAPNSVYSTSPHPPHEAPNAVSSPSQYPPHVAPNTVYSPPRYPSPLSPEVVSIPVHVVSSNQPQKNMSMKDLSALKIQKVFRGYRVRKSVKKIVIVQNEVNKVEQRINNVKFVKIIRKDPKERLRVNEDLMSLLFKLDSIRGVDFGVRALRKSVTRKAIALQEKLDSIA